MRALHAITGLPRSGSTLLCNILNQNPEFYASSTSALCRVVKTYSDTLSVSEEIRSDMIHDKERTDDRTRRTAQSIALSWYEDHADKAVFDKSRGWAANSLLLADMFGNSKLLVCVRDLRAVLGSIEKQHRREALLNIAPAVPTLLGRVEQQLSVDGLVGSCVPGILDLYDRKLKNFHIVRYEDLAARPQAVLEGVYDFLGLPRFEHDFNNVVNTATDADGMYLNKFPHVGAGKVTPPNTDEWRDYFSSEIASGILNAHMRYTTRFGYLE